MAAVRCHTHTSCAAGNQLPFLPSMLSVYEIERISDYRQASSTANFKTRYLISTSSEPLAGASASHTIPTCTSFRTQSHTIHTQFFISLINRKCTNSGITKEILVQNTRSNLVQLPILSLHHDSEDVTGITLTALAEWVNLVIFLEVFTSRVIFNQWRYSSYLATG